MQAIFETLFDAVYLATVITLGIIMIKRSVGAASADGGSGAVSRGSRQYLLFGIMAVTLGAGDSFHLVPRALALCTTGLDDYTAALGVGKLITSVTMTAFYVLLYYVWRSRYRVSGKNALTAAVWALALARVVLCLMPQNDWTGKEPPLLWGIIRNIPFAAIGGVVIVLFLCSARKHGDGKFRFMWLTIVLSFGFYIPVVLFADVVPLIGMLMIPKTCAYVWTVLIGFNAMRGDLKNEKVS
ncbi:MAG: hypothetical protein ACI4XA_04535 [Oscillospiraceae bacterium]